MNAYSHNLEPRAARSGIANKGGMALLLAAALAASSARAADPVDSPDRAAAVARSDAARAEGDRARAESDRARTEADRAKAAKAAADRDARLEDAQARLSRAASEVAALAAERAADAMEHFTWLGDAPRRTIIGVQLDSAGGREGAHVKDVSPGGPAEQAGIRAGDVIVAVNGKDVVGKEGPGQSAPEVVRLLRDVAPNSKVKVRVLRDGKPKDFEVTARPFDRQTFSYRIEPPPGIDGVERFGEPIGPIGPLGLFEFARGYRNEIEGMELTTLTPQLGRYFGTDKGVLVVRAPGNDVFKLQEGDVILSIDGREPTSGSHITRILRSYQPGEKLTLRVMRDRKPMDIAVTLPDDKRERRTRTTWQNEQPT